MIWAVYFDGVCDPNPGGPMAWGFAIDPQNGDLVTGNGIGRWHAGNTNNVAEYYALGHSVKRVVDMLQSPVAPKFSGLHIRGDSQLVCNQVNDQWQVKSEHLAQLHRRVLQLLAETGQPWRLEWVPREQNELADKLSREAYRNLTGHPPCEYVKVKR